MEVAGIEAMHTEATRFVAGLSPQSGGATIVALSGELGAGKTTFAQALAKALGVEEAVTSPTFVIEKIYELEGQKFAHLIHIDAYRLKDAHELEVLGWKEITADQQNLIIVEWPERIAELIPSEALRISFEGSGETRHITYG